MVFQPPEAPGSALDELLDSPSMTPKQRLLATPGGAAAVSTEIGEAPTVYKDGRVESTGPVSTPDATFPTASSGTADSGRRALITKPDANIDQRRRRERFSNAVTSTKSGVNQAK